MAGNGINAYIGLRLTNNTGSAINSFTLSFDGEQWRDGPSTGPQSLLFDYSTTADADTWATSGSFTSVPQLNFTAPVFSSTTGAIVDGNTAGKVSLSANVFGLTWDPGTDLWLRWSNAQLPDLTDDGLAIDNLVFTAPSTGPVPDINSATSGNSSSGSTWVGGDPPAAGFIYHVLSGHTVTIDAAMPTASLIEAQSGSTINIGPAGNGVTIPNMTIAAGGALTVSATGDVSIGDPNARGNLVLNNDTTFTIDPGPASPTCDLCLNMKITGTGNITINSAPGTSVSIPQAAGMTGTVTFNGTGDVVKVDGSESIPRLVMNSTGQNRVAYLNADVGNLTFNQPGSIDHLTTGSRLQGGTLIANAQVTVNETTGFPDDTTQTDERRWQTTSLQGSGNIVVNGTATDFTNATGTVTLNEFEVGTTGEPTGAVPNSAYGGTLTFNNYINGELRQNLRRAAVVINDKARVEFGFQVQYPDPAKFLNVGEVTVNSGGTLEVGFEQGPVTGSPFYQTSPTAGVGNHVARLNITSSNGRSGNLTMTSGATLRMQINGIEANQFDSITATGNVDLGGATLDLLINPVSTNTVALDAYFPTDGDTFTLISILPKPVQGDYDGSGTVDALDYTTWRATYGSTSGALAADGNNDGVVDSADYVVWLKNLGQSSSVVGSISGDININLVDPFLSTTGFTIEKIITATSLQVKFHAAGSGASEIASIPEPSTLVLGSLLLACAVTFRRGRVGRES